MVQMLLEVLGGDARHPAAREADTTGTPSFSRDRELRCYHVDSRFSDDIGDIGRIRWGKAALLFKYCAEAIWCRLRHGVTNFYYIPAPGMRSAVYRDWLVMLLCRPFFRRVVFHWEAAGLGEWLVSQARPWERWLTCRLLGRHDLSIVLGDYYQSDVAILRPKSVIAIPNAAPDPCPDFDTLVRPRRQARVRVRAKLMTGEAPSNGDLKLAGTDPQIFRVLYLSTCVREKGLFDTVEAVALANRQLSEERSPVRFHLTVAGKFWQETEHREFQRRLEQPDLNGPARQSSPAATVEYRGFAAGEEKHRLFLESDCFCFPTYYAFEGHPVSLVEAMSYNLPIITTRWRAIPELFPNGYGGLVQPRAPEQVAAVLRQFARTGPEQDFRKEFLTQFTEQRFAERMRQTLRQLEHVS